MSREAHTAGPWKAFESTIRPGVWYVGNEHYGLLRTDTTSNPEADARLAAAAPALLEACNRALELLEPFDDPDLSLGLGSEALTPLRAAIHSATGEG